MRSLDGRAETSLAQEVYLCSRIIQNLTMQLAMYDEKYARLKNKYKKLKKLNEQQCLTSTHKDV